MEETYMSWSMMLIGISAVGAGIVGYRLPDGQRLSVALPLLVGAGIGLTALFAQGLIFGFEQGTGARSFLVASMLGLATVLGGLAVLVRLARRTARLAQSPA